MKRKKIKLGDIFSIPLPNGMYAFGRLYKEYTLAIYKEKSKYNNKIPENKKYDFFVGVYSDILTNGKWTVIGNIPFAHDDDAWRPPTYVKDILNGKYSIYERGIIRSATKHECNGLELTATWDEHHLIERLLSCPVVSEN